MTAFPETAQSEIKSAAARPAVNVPGVFKPVGFVTILSRSIPAHGPGGMERATWLVAEGLANLGWRVRILTTQMDPVNLPRNKGIEVRPIESAPAKRYSSAYDRGVRSVLADTAPGEVILSVSAAGFDYLQLPQNNRHPVALVCHGTSWDEIRSKWKSLTLRSLVGLARQLTWIPKDLIAYRRADRIITVNDPITGQIIRLLPRSQRAKVTTIYNGNAPTKEIESDQRAALGAFVICTSGRLVREKGIHLLLVACSLLPATERPDEIYICGDGPALSALKKKSQDLALKNIVFTGHVNSVTPFLKRASVLVLPSLRLEGLPMSVIEALGIGCPAIIPSSLAFPNVNQPGLLRFVSGDSVDLARALRASRQVGRHAGLVAELSFDTMIKGYAEVLSSLSMANRSTLSASRESQP